MIWFQRPACQVDIAAAGCLRVRNRFPLLRVCNSLALWVIRSFRGLWLSQNSLVSSIFVKELLKPPIKSRLVVKPQGQGIWAIVSFDCNWPTFFSSIESLMPDASLRFADTIETSRDQNQDTFCSHPVPWITVAFTCWVCSGPSQLWFWTSKTTVFENICLSYKYMVLHVFLCKNNGKTVTKCSIDSNWYFKKQSSD